ncbi:DNA starvation/stationary phase protection protein [Thiomicrorhabdus sp.]|uniref:Dps family protein n=1 Tax=Thiomicrorhabdus sp. TaxID=2039724 RepID=UPI0029C8AE98|nr:DNA starvation/stationary phase protection protein [Thiomicrorhabdus sp.]
MSVANQLKSIQANAHAYYLQLHQVHWLVQGSRFKAMHEMTESYYERMSELYDDAGERLLQKGLLPILNQKELLQASTIAELTATRFNEKDVLEYVEAMLNHWSTSFKALAASAEDEGDRVTTAMADGQLETLEKDIWMLKATKGEAAYL